MAALAKRRDPICQREITLEMLAHDNHLLREILARLEARIVELQVPQMLRGARSDICGANLRGDAK